MENNSKCCSKYFTQEEWNKLSHYEKFHKQSTYELYVNMIKSGIQISKPDFMTRTKVQPEIQDEIASKQKSTENNEHRAKILRVKVKNADHYIFECPNCHLKFSKPTYLDNHINQCDNKKDNHPEKTFIKIIRDGNTSNNNNESYKCHMIVKPCRYEKNEAHSINNQDNSTKNTDNKRNNKEANNKRHKCSECNKAFITPSKLKVHTRIHTRDRQKLLHTGEKRHELVTHSATHCSTRSFQCTICKKTFTKSSYLTSHMHIHTGHKPFHCDICEYKSTHLGNLKKHFQTHTGERPFECILCKKTFARTDNLTSHMYIHFEQKPFHCDLCKYKSTHAANLKKHIRTHTGEKPFECNVCKKTFTQSNDLTTHMYVHTKQTPFHCKFCEYKTTHSSNLRKHIRTHTGEKPFECNVCNKTFSQNSNLTKHINKLHNEDA